MTSATGRPCSAAAALDIVGDRWALQAVREIYFGNRRFSEIVRNTGAPRDRLAARLKTLVAAGVLERRQYQESPPREDYHLTAAGRDLIPVLHALRQWGDRWAVDVPPLTMRHHDHALHTRTVCTECGEPVHQADVTRTMTAPGWDMAGPVSFQ
ncbi:MAG TPA: helix-turn-helix domain-containing protein [Mycobacteriales bacterium]|nr:helix-turn-helix domain-containing protein [Mycobacteriales bacterium]